jgi:hypothetical protein
MPPADLTPLWHTAAELERQIETDLSGLDVLEGKRFLLRMLAASVDTYVEHDDTERPAFHHAASPTRKMFADCPDTDYLRAPIAVGPGRCYRVWGRIPKGTLYVGVLLYGKGGRVGNRLADTDLPLDAHGRFELFVSTDPQPGTWLAADGDETAVLVRQYFTDRDVQPPIEVHVELVGAAKASIRPAAERLPEQLTRAERMLRSVFKRTLQAHQMIQKGPANRFLDIPGERLFPTPDNKYRAARFQLDEGSRLWIRGRLPAARYFGLTLYNVWLESLDYRHHPVSLNHAQLQCEPDGSFQVCVADTNSDAGNWLSTAGHRVGYIIARTLLPDGEMPRLEVTAGPAK